MLSIGTLSFHPKADFNKLDKTRYKAYSKANSVITHKTITTMLPSLEELNENYKDKSFYTCIDGKTGSGKSTIFIKALFKHYHTMNVLVLEPRINLTVLNAHSLLRKTDSLNGLLEDEIGWQNSSSTKEPVSDYGVTFATTQIMNNAFFGSSNTKGLKRKYKDTILVVDEVHQLDLPMLTLLLNLKKHQDIFRMVILMSATADFERIGNYFDIDYSDPRCYFKVEGSKSFKVKKLYLEDVAKMNDDNEPSTLHEVGVFIGKYMLKEMSKVTGDTEFPYIDLAYILPVKTMFHEVEDGIREVFETKKQTKFNVMILKYSSGGEANDYASVNVFRRIPKTVKIILTTPAIEIGQTIGTLKTIIDSGLHYTPYYSPLSITQHSRHEGYIVPIAKTKQTQRIGRVGRVMNGVAILMYSKKIDDQLEETDYPENLTIPSLFNLNKFIEIDDESNSERIDDRLSNYKQWFKIGQEMFVPNSIATTIRTINDMISVDESHSSLSPCLIQLLNSGCGLFEALNKIEYSGNGLLKSSITSNYNQHQPLTSDRVSKLCKNYKSILTDTSDF